MKDRPSHLAAWVVLRDDAWRFVVLARTQAENSPLVYFSSHRTRAAAQAVADRWNRLRAARP